MKKDIKIGYEVNTGKSVNVKPHHMVVTGVTDLSGKTTTLVALIKRSGMKAVIFKTKPGEKAIDEGSVIPLFYKVQKWGWEYLLDLLEAERKEKLKLHRSAIMDIADHTTDLLSAQKLINECIESGKTAKNRKMNSFQESIYTELKNFLSNVVPYFQTTHFSNRLDLQDGINIMDLERYTDEVQMLVIRSVLEEVLKNHKNTLCIIPEAWRFCPQGRNTPCKLPAESYIRQGATNKNYLAIDSQDIVGVEKRIIRQVSLWFLGYQTEMNEVKRVIAQIPLGKKSKPTPEEIMTLKTGEFYISTRDFVKKTYIQPIWMNDKTALLIAKGKKSVDDIKKLKKHIPFSTIPEMKEKVMPSFEAQKYYTKTQQDLIDMREDFFNKISEVRTYINNIGQEIANIKLSIHNDFNTDEIVSKVLQKIPQGSDVNEQNIISKVLEKIPKFSGGVTYEVSPLEKINKDFLEESKTKILQDISGLSNNAKKLLKYLESKRKGIKSLELEQKCFFMKHSGASTKKVSEASIELRSIGVAKKDTAGYHRGCLKDIIADYLKNHGATEEEINQVYDHILYDIIKGD